MRLCRRDFSKKARANPADEGAERESTNIDTRKQALIFSQATKTLSLSDSASGGSARGCEASPAQPHGNGQSDYTSRKRHKALS